MLTYTFSRREKALILALALVMVLIVWFVFVYQASTNRIAEAEGQIAAMQVQISADETRVSQQEQMQSVIDQRKAEGVEPTIMPEYDNLQRLMTELNGTMADAESYTLSFDELVKDFEQGHIERGVTINFQVANYKSAERIVEELVGGPYPCRIDSVATSIHYENINVVEGKGGTAKTDATIHATFFESMPQEMIDAHNAENKAAA